MSKTLRVTLWFVAIAGIASGAYWGLVWAPPDREMGDVQRIMYVHVPAVWMALLAATLNFGASVAYLFKPHAATDALAEASAEVGLVFGSIGVALGSIWGRPTWGVWWDWDPRLTSAAVMLMAYAGYMALRKFVDDPERRAVWAAVAGIVTYVDIPVVWFSVRWWRSLHQMQSSPRTVDPSMVFALRWNALAFLVCLILFLWLRYALARQRQEADVAPPPLAPVMP
ncbi:MAG: cytochrome c biogenesis protein CcsA [Myxococcaceae bacterium]